MHLITLPYSSCVQICTVLAYHAVITTVFFGSVELFNSVTIKPLLLNLLEALDFARHLAPP